MTEALCASLTEARLPALHKLHVFAAVTCHTLVCYFYATGSKALAMPALARLLLSGVGANGDGISQQTRATADLIRRQFLQHVLLTLSLRSAPARGELLVKF